LGIDSLRQYYTPSFLNVYKQNSTTGEIPTHRAMSSTYLQKIALQCVGLQTKNPATGRGLIVIYQIIQ